MEKPYRLSLDINTSAVGLCAYELDENNKPSGILHLDCQTFGEPLADSEKGVLKKAYRRQKRGMRRQTDRRAQRLRKIAHLFSLVDLSSTDVYAVQGDAVHKYRSDAATKKITLEQLMAVLLLMAKNRGYNGRFVSEDGKIKKIVEGLESQLQESGHRTMGQFLYERKKSGLQSPVIQDWKKVSEGEGSTISAGTYITRVMLKDEFEVIFNKQQKYHPSLLKPCPKEIKDRFFSYSTIETNPLETVRDAFYHALFDQRPLWWKTETIGLCPLEKDRPRAVKAHSAFQVFRIEKTVQDLAWERGQPLTEEERTFIRNTMLAQKTVKAEALYEEFGVQNSFFNLDRERRTGIECEFHGNQTQSAIKKLEKKTGLSLSREESNLFIELLADVGDASAFSVEGWEKQEIFKDYFHGYSDSEKKNIISFMENLIEQDELKTLAKMNFDSGRAAYSVEALEKLTREMMENNLTEYDAIENLYPEKKNVYGSTKIEKIGDGVVQQALRETRKAVEYVIQKYGNPREVVVELSRDMKLSQEKRRVVENQQKNKQGERERCREALKRAGFEGSDINVKRYLFWEEQNKTCPYCGAHIALDDAMDGSKTNFEHTIPKNKGGENTHTNLTLAHRSCNTKKGERLPFEAFTTVESRNPIIAMSKVLEEKGKKGKYAYWKEVTRKAKLLVTETLDDIEDLEDFKLRQNTENSWIAREIYAWLEWRINAEKEDRIYISKGRLTGYLRRKLGLNTLIPDIRHKEGKPVFNREKTKKKRTKMDVGSWHESFSEGEKRYDKRIDHRHHVVDAAVVGLVNRTLFKEATLYNKRHGKMKGFFRYLQKEQMFPYLENLRKDLYTRLLHYEVWHKPDRRPMGDFFKENKWRREKNNAPLEDSVEKEYDKLIQRQSLEFLLKETKDKTLQALELIVGNTIREHVQREFERRYELLENRTNEKERVKFALCGKDAQDGIFFPLYKNKHQQQKIKKIRCYQKRGGVKFFREDMGSKTLFVKTSEHSLTSGGYACVEVNEENNKFICIPYWKFWSKDYQQRMGNDGFVRLFKNDMIFNEKDQSFYVIKQLSSEKGIRCIRSTETNTFDKLDQTVSRSFSSHAFIRLIENRMQLVQWKQRIASKDES